MTSTLHAQSARENGAKSKGPITERGKAASAQNALKHGLSAKRFELSDPSDQAVFADIERELVETYLAVTPVQKRQATQMAIAMWRQQIVANMEMSLLAAIQAGQATANEGGAGLPSLNSIYRYRARIERDLKLAGDTLKALQEARMRMFEAKIAKAQEFSQLSMLGQLEADLGPEGFAMFRADVTNEPNTPPTPPEPTTKPNREQRRRQEAIARKRKK